MKTKEFEFKIMYFKASGGFYTECFYNVRSEALEVGNEELRPYMPGIVEKLKELRDRKIKGFLPGLCGCGWVGFILVEHEDGYPCLILPK